MAVSVTIVDVVVDDDDIDDSDWMGVRVWTTGSRLSMAVSSDDSRTSENPSNRRTNCPVGDEVTMGVVGC